MRRRICAATAGLLLGVAFHADAAAQAEGILVLSPNTGFVGDGVQAEQDVNRCAIFVVRWKGEVVGTDDGHDGRGTVFFRVPDGRGTTQTVVATCKASPGGTERVVGEAPFSVLDGDPTTTTTTTTLPLPTTTLAATTTVPPTSVRPTLPGTRPSTVTTAPPSPSPTRTPSASTTTTSRRTTGGPTTPTSRGASTTTPATPSSPVLVPQEVADCENQARNAESRLVYQPNRRMILGFSYDVVVQVALDFSDVSAVTTPGAEPTTIVRLRSARCTIEAQLIGAASDFQVTPPAPLAQSFIASRVLTWRWQVVPLRTDPGLKLVLRLQPTVVEDGRPPRPGSDEIHEALIEVDARPQSLISQVGEKANGLLANNIVKLLLIPSGGGLLTLWVGRRFRRRAKDSAGHD